MSPRPANPRELRRGFTLLELLTVIAIIAILAGLLFPVFSQVRESARKSACMSNMKQLIQALKVYKDDWHSYPETLYGGYYRNNGGTCNAYPNDYVRKGLYPEYVKSEDVFVCPNSVTKLDSNMKTSAAAIAALNRTQGVNSCWAVPNFSSYDFQFVPNNTSGAQELRYAKKWTAPGTPIASESQRQLYWREPPDSTVVTWCTYHNALDASNQPAKGGMVVVGFLGGNVKNVSATTMLGIGWTPTGGPWLQKPSK